MDPPPQVGLGAGFEGPNVHAPTERDIKYKRVALLDTRVYAHTHDNELANTTGLFSILSHILGFISSMYVPMLSFLKIFPICPIFLFLIFHPMNGPQHGKIAKANWGLGSLGSKRSSLV